MLKNVTLVLLVMIGCGGKTIDQLDDGGTNDGGPKGDAIYVDVPAPSDAIALPDSSLACNEIDPGTKTVPVMQVAQDPGPFAGTTASIQPGLYELVSFTLYTGPNGSSGNGGTIAGEVRVNVANSADYIFQAATQQDNQAPSRSNSDGNTAGPGVLAISQTCPSQGNAMKVAYYADSTSFTIRVDTGNATADETFDFVSP
jgi:hypothetical protein